MSISRTGLPYPTTPDWADDDLAAPAAAPRVLEGGRVKMGHSGGGGGDDTPPTLVSASPADDMNNVATASSITLTFSEDMAQGAGNIIISNGHSQSYINKDGDVLSRIVGATDTRTISVNDADQVTISGATVTIHPATPLQAGMTYSVTMASGVLNDGSDNPYAGLSTSTQLNFTTAASHSAPTAQIGPTIAFEDTGLSSTDYITNSAAQTLTGTYSGTLGANEFVQVSLDNGASWHLANSGANSWSYSGTAITSSSTLLARVSNIYGQSNSSGTASHSYTFDNVAPEATVTSGSLSLSADSGTSGDFITNTASQTISGQYTGTLGAGETIRVSIDNGATYGTATVDTVNHTWTYAATLATGASNTIQAYITDVAGNGSAAVTHSYLVSTATAYSLSGASTALGSSSGSAITKLTAPSITVGGLGNGGLHVGDVIEIIDSSNGSAVVGSFTLQSGNLDHYGGGFLINGDSNISAKAISVSGLSEGTHTLVAEVVDQYGNVGVASTPLSLKVDLTAPTLTTITHADADSNVSTPDAIVLTFNEDVVLNSGTVVRLLDQGKPDSPILLSTDNTGQVTVSGHTITLQATGPLDSNATYDISLPESHVSDVAGNTTFSNGFVLGHIITDGSGHVSSTIAASVVSLALSADTGTSSTDYITATATQTISGTYSGTLAANEHIEFSVDSGSTWTTATTAANGSWSYSNATLLSGSGNMLEARVANDAGASAGTASQSYTLQTAAPSLSTLTLTLANDTGLSTVDHDTTHLTNTQQAQISFDLTGTSGLHAGDVVQVTDGGATASYTLTVDDVNGDGAYIGAVQTVTLDFSSQSDAVHSVSAKLVDIAGNTGVASTALAVTVDTTAPAGDILGAGLSVLADDDSGYSSTDHNTNTLTPRMTADLSSATGLVAGDVLQIIDSSNGNVVVASHVLTSGEITNHTAQLQTTTLADGDHALSLQLADAAGNIAANGGFASTTPITVTIDGMAPVGNIHSTYVNVLAADDTGSSSSDNITSVTAPRLYADITGTGAVAGDVLRAYDASNSDAVIATYVLTASDITAGNAQLQSAILSTGSHTISLELSDAAGNVADDSGHAQTPSTTITIYDTTPSLVSITGALASGSDSGTSGDNITNVTTPGFTVDLTGIGAVLHNGDTVKIIDNSNSSAVVASYTITAANSDLDGAGTAQHAFTLANVSSLSDGSHDLLVQLFDPTGTFLNTTPLTVTVDTTAPTSYTLNLSDNQTSVTPNSAITLTFGEAVQVASGTHIYILDAQSNLIEDITLTSSNISGDVLSFTPTQLTYGTTYTVALHAGDIEDVAGNVGVSASTLVHFTTAALLPSAMVATISWSNDTGSSTTDFITNHSAQTISGTYTGTLNSGEKVRVSVDNGDTWHDADSYAGGAWSYHTTFETDISSTIKAEVVDANNANATTAASQAYTYDHTAPLLSSTSVDSGTPSVKVGSLTLNYSDAFTIANGTTLLLTDGSDSHTFTYGDTSHFQVSGNAITLDFTGSTLDALGAYQLTVSSGSIADTAGNAVPMTSFTTGHAAPTAVVSSISLYSDTGSSSSDFITNSQAQTVTGTYSGTLASGEQIYFSSDGGSTFAAATDLGSGNWSYTPTLGGNVSNSFEVKISNADSTISTTTLTQAYVIDTTAPTATIDTGTGNYLNTSQLTLTFGEDVTLASSAYIQISDGNGDIQQVSVTSADLSSNVLTVPLSSVLTKPSTVYTVSLYSGSIADTAGNVAGTIGTFTSGTGGNYSATSGSTLSGGSGDDTFTVTDYTMPYTSISGGLGSDTLAFNFSSAHTVSLYALPQTSGIDIVDSINAGNTINIAGYGSVTALVDGNSTTLLTIYGHDALTIRADLTGTGGTGSAWTKTVLGVDEYDLTNGNVTIHLVGVSTLTNIPS